MKKKAIVFSLFLLVFQNIHAQSIAIKVYGLSNKTIQEKVVYAFDNT